MNEQKETNGETETKVSHKKVRNPRQNQLRSIACATNAIGANICTLGCFEGCSEAVMLLKQAFALTKAARTIVRLAPHQHGSLIER